MPVRSLPVRPDLEQLSVRPRNCSAPSTPASRMRRRSARAPPESIDPARGEAGRRAARARAQLSGVELDAARPRVQLADAIWRDDVDDVRALVTRKPDAAPRAGLIRPDSNWGPPMTYAANLGRDRIIRHAARARRDETSSRRSAAPRCRARSSTARMLIDLVGEPPPLDGCARRPRLHAERAGTALAARARRPRRVTTQGTRLAPVGRRARDRQPEPGRQAPHPGDVRRARLRASRHAGDGAASRAHRPARGAPRARSAGSSRARSRTRDLSARAGLPRAVHATQGTPLAGRRSCTCARTTTSWRSRGGCSTAGWIRTRARRWTPTASAATRRSSRGRVAAQLLGELRPARTVTARRSRSCCSTAAPTRTCARRSGSSCTRGGDTTPPRVPRRDAAVVGPAVPRADLRQ